MLKVVGASWLQTRISSYILLFVALLGLGAIIIGEYGHKAKNDETYSATVTWTRQGGYRIEFLGQGNDLKTIPLRAARAYYKTEIHKTGWSTIEIETSSKYSDDVQAYAAGLLEGSLTWQLIHHHWDNTVNVFCQNYPVDCQFIKKNLKKNKDIIFERSKNNKNKDPFWRMVRLFYSQLDGLERGWKYSAHRNRQSVEMGTEDFLWLAFQADLTNLVPIWNSSDDESKFSKRGLIYLKILQRANKTPLISIGHNTFGPYVRMLRLLKRYKFQYAKTAITMSSYPGAISSHDEFYLIGGKTSNLVIAGTPLDTSRRNLWVPNDQTMPTVRTMAANRLAIDGKSWSRIIAFENRGTLMPRQWIVYEPWTGKLWLIEQFFDATRVADCTKEFVERGFLICSGRPYFSGTQIDRATTRNITIVEDVRKFMRENGSNNLTGDVLAPVGVIDTKLVLVDVDGLESLEVTSGPMEVVKNDHFVWSKFYPNVQHVGHPNVFNFPSVTPSWVWK